MSVIYVYGRAVLIECKNQIYVEIIEMKWSPAAIAPGPSAGVSPPAREIERCTLPVSASGANNARVRISDRERKPSTERQSRGSGEGLALLEGIPR